MNTRRRLNLLVVMTSFILTAFGFASAVAQEKPDDSAYDWLNGKWYGRNPSGGPLELHLRVKGNQITGQSLNPRPGAKRDFPKSVTGTVEGDKVHLELYDNQTGTQRWNFSHKEGNLVATRKGEEFIFKKLK